MFQSCHRHLPQPCHGFQISCRMTTSHFPALFCGGAGDDKTVPAVVALSADHQQRAGLRKDVFQFGVGCKPGVLHHLQIGQAVSISGLFDGLHLCSRDNTMLHFGTSTFQSYRPMILHSASRITRKIRLDRVNSLK